MSFYSCIKYVIIRKGESEGWREKEESESRKNQVRNWTDSEVKIVSGKTGAVFKKTIILVFHMHGN